MTRRTSRIPTALAGLALLAVTATACGSDDGSDTTATDTTSASTSVSPSDSASPSPSIDPSESPVSGSATPEPDPVPSPLINKAVKAALQDDFPAMVPSGVPAGWTVVSATYDKGIWTIAMTDPSGKPVTLLQVTGTADQVVGQLLPDASASGKVQISGTGKWDAYQGMNAAALAKDVSGTGVAVVGADIDTVTTFVQQLLTAEDSGQTDGG